MYPARTEPIVIKNATHSSIGCNGMAKNDAYHGLERYKNHAKDSTTEGCMQSDETNTHEMRPNQSVKGQGNTHIETEPMIKDTTHFSMGCNGMANNDDHHGLEMYKNHAKDSTRAEGYMQPDPTNMQCGRINPSKVKATLLSSAGIIQVARSICKITKI